jgi:hypothetical protein
LCLKDQTGRCILGLNWAMQTQNSASRIWIIGNTRRERAVVGVAFVSGCQALVWALVNDLRFGHEGAEAHSRLFTNGRFEASMVLRVFFSCVAISALGVLSFWWFRFLSRGYNGMANHRKPMGRGTGHQS